MKTTVPILDKETITNEQAKGMLIDTLLIGSFTPNLTFYSTGGWVLHLLGRYDKTYVLWGKVRDGDFAHKIKMIISMGKDLTQDDVKQLIAESSQLGRFKRKESREDENTLLPDEPSDHTHQAP